MILSSHLFAGGASGGTVDVGRPRQNGAAAAATLAPSAAAGVLALPGASVEPSAAAAALGTSIVPSAGPGAAPTGAAAGARAGPALALSAASRRRRRPAVPVPEWHAPWRLAAVVSGHLGWVRCCAFDVGNEWFVTGGQDRTIKIWDLAKCCAGAEGGLKLTLTGHLSAVRGLAVSERHPYLFSAGEDKKVFCWDLEYNRAIRHYHGHLSGIYCLALHPTLDVLFTGGRDAVCRVWDMRTKHEVHVLGGHSDTVSAVAANAVDPQVVTGSMDATVRGWDLVAGKTLYNLTHHAKGVRALAQSPTELTFCSGARDAVRQWATRDGTLMNVMKGHDAIVNALAVTEDGVLVSGGDDGTLQFRDYKTGYCFQRHATVAQPGSIDAETGIYATCFDMSGSRLVTCEADRTIKIWKEVEDATPETHPVDMDAWTRELGAAR